MTDAEQLVNELRQRVSGNVVASGDKQYDKQRTPWLQVVDQHPLAIVNAESVEDIIQSVRFAAAKRLSLAVQNTGHGIIRPCDGGILLRLSGMKAITVDTAARTATVEPGVCSGPLLDVAEPHGLVYPTGQASNVGIIGYTPGGGFGWMGRQAGAASRFVRSATVVLADGSVVTASSSEHPDLLWGLKGGGGNFGVVASMTVSLLPQGKIFGGMVYYRMENAPEILRFYKQWTSELGNETSTNVRLMKLPPKPGFLVHALTETCVIGICHTDLSTKDELQRRITDFKEPVINDLAVRPFSEMAQYDEASNMDGSPTFSHLECLRELTDELLTDLVAVAQKEIPPVMQFEVQHLGGKLTEAANEDGAYMPPQAPYLLHLVAPAIKTPLAEVAAATSAAFEALGDVYTGEVSYNYLRGDQQALVPAAFGDQKYVRLQGIKWRYDPLNLFDHNLNIPPSAVE